MEENAQIVIEIADWMEEALHREEPPQTIEEMVALAKALLSPRKAGELTIAWIQLGQSPPDLLPTCKVMLGKGAGMVVHRHLKALEGLLKINGREYRARLMTKVVPPPEPGEASAEGEDQLVFEGTPPAPAPVDMPSEGWVNAGTPESAENARRYLRQVVPGHIWPRLVEIAAAGEDARAPAEELCHTIMAMAGRLE